MVVWLGLMSGRDLMLRTSYMGKQQHAPNFASSFFFCFCHSACNNYSLVRSCLPCFHPLVQYVERFFFLARRCLILYSIVIILTCAIITKDLKIMHKNGAKIASKNVNKNVEKWAENANKNASKP